MTRGWLLLAATSLLLGLAGCFENEPPKKPAHQIDPNANTDYPGALGSAYQRGQQSACEQYLGQLNQTVQMYRVSNDSNPPDLATVIKESGLPASELQGCEYAYDPATGRVSLKK
jgi:hypothetical protein